MKNSKAIFLSFVTLILLTAVVICLATRKTNDDKPVIVVASISPTATDTPTLPDPAEKARITNLYGKLPLTFVENKGQYDEKVRFCARSPQATVYFCQNEVVFHFIERGDTMHQRDRQMRFSNDANTNSPMRDDQAIDCVPEDLSLEDGRSDVPVALDNAAGTPHLQ